MPNPEKNSVALTCRGCAHYHITWDGRFPYGCRAMGFKSRRIPRDVVRGSFPGTDCMAFTPLRKR